ncbi:MAG: Hok/Gef family protein [Leclercia adecarboxylata]|uniref:Type I toxin-antitoxin system Hok family toxin n=1 Tax=Leclercia adecarboxylata TaxID=83655 RepID=A0AAP9ALC1_9ENTR|nr:MULTISPECIES: Hok/Gef family protein [Leclercia]HCN96762.1 Hok/Gef family protein [Leclercia sp.]MDU1059304.1 Hok/Gef family protein [Leclercia adecarboxylata]MDU4839816.1 Hok/Gef family protein [Leclercia adecarboxylata]QDK19632.1 type I toxin-antitoxin system Hok family toxin [Leclercia adecarboxylata]UGB02737.1 type I toxin-antitoxin system Hok family toxin [Leclercia sp. G3L]
MLNKYAFAAILVLGLTVLGVTFLVHEQLCELSFKERDVEVKAVLAYETKK